MVISMIMITLNMLLSQLRFLEAAQVSLSQTNCGTKAVVCINFA
jgi:hypothetical protein